MTRAVVNSTPLIALSITGHLSLLKALFDEVIVPASVYEEVVLCGQGRPGGEEVRNASWILVKEPKEKCSIPPALLGLDQGEIDVILLAQEVGADWVLIDEKLGRKVAETLGLRVKGTLGVLLTAYQTHLLSREAAEKVIEILSTSSVRVSPRLVRWFQTQLDEGTE